MEYSIYEDILLQIPESELAILTGDPTGTTVNLERVDAARTNADSTIDTYLWGVYNVPFVEEPIYPLIRKIAVDLTIVYLYETAYKDSNMPNTIIWKRIYAIKMLKDLRNGLITVTDLQRITEPPPSILTNKTEDRIFSNDELDKFSDLWEKL